MKTARSTPVSPRSAGVPQSNDPTCSFHFPSIRGGVFLFRFRLTAGRIPLEYEEILLSRKEDTVPNRILSLFALIRVTPSQSPTVVDPDVEFAMIRRAPPRPPFWGKKEIVHELWSLGCVAPIVRKGSVAEALETLAHCDRVFEQERSYTILEVQLRAPDWFREHLVSTAHVACRYVIEEDHASLLRKEVIFTKEQTFVVLFRGRLLIAAYTAPVPQEWTTGLFRILR